MVGYEPPELSTLKGAQLARHRYFQDTLAQYNFGELLFLSNEDAKKQIHDINPLLVFAFDDFIAKELKEIKRDYLLYVIPSYSQIFSRKDEIEEKKGKLNKIFTEAEGLVMEVISGEKDDADLRKFTALTYDELYKMITKAIISEDEDLKAKAWDLLWGEGEKHSDLIWMRVQMMAEVWEHSKGEQLEQLMLMSMERHIDQGTARKMDNFIDADGQRYHQYMFLDPYGDDLKHIRRLPCAKKDQDRYGYEAWLERCEIPTNYIRIQVEANSLRKQWDDHLAEECAKVRKVLEEYEKDPGRSKKELGVAAGNSNDPDKPLEKNELEYLNNFFEKYSI